MNDKKVKQIFSATVNTKKLKEALIPHTELTKSKSSFILEAIKIEVDELKYLQLYSTNLEMHLNTFVKSKAEGLGRVAVPFKTLEKAVSTCDTETMILEAIEESWIEEQEIIVEEGRWIEETQEWTEDITKKEDVMVKEIKLKVDKLTLNTISIEEFPEFPEIKTKEEVKKENIITLNDWKGFIETLEKTKDFNKAPSYTYRPILESYYLDLKNDCIVATNSYFLAKVSYHFGVKEFDDDDDVNDDDKNEANENKVNKNAIILPNIIYPLLKKIDKNIKDNTNFFIYYNENEVKLQVENHTLWCRQISGKYPDYLDLFPKDFNLAIEFSIESALKILNKVQKIFGDEQSQITLELNEAMTKLVFSREHKEIGSFEDEIDVVEAIIKDELKEKSEDKKEVEGEERPWLQKSKIMPITFNPYFLKLCIKNFKQLENVRLNIVDSLKPAVFEMGYGDEYLIMPIKTE